MWVLVAPRLVLPVVDGPAVCRRIDVIGIIISA